MQSDSLPLTADTNIMHMPKIEIDNSKGAVLTNEFLTMSVLGSLGRSNILPFGKNSKRWGIK